MNIQIHLQIGSLAQLNRASDYGSEGYRFESYASHLRILISSSVFGSNEIRIFSISTGRIIIIHIFAVNTKNILFKIKGKHLKAHYKTSIAISLIVIIVLVILRTTVTGQDSIKFIDDTDDQPIDQQNSDSIDLRYSNEYQSWKQTSDTTFRSLFNGNQQADILAEHPVMVVLWAGYAFSKDYLSPRGHMYSIEDLYKSLRTGSPMTPTSGPQPAACWACKSPDIPRLLTTTDAKTLYKKKWAELGNEIVNPIGCADCHEPQSMGLRVTRSFLKSAYKRNGLRIEDATEQEMRSLVCAQCHAEYYFQGEDRILT